MLWSSDWNCFFFSGPMMKLVYKLQAEEFKFEIPVIHLPVRTIPLYQRPSIQPVILANTVSPFLSLTLTFYLSHFRFPSPLCPQPPIVPGSNKGLYPGRGPAWLSSVPQQAAPSSDWSLEPNSGSEYPSFMFTHVSSHITTCHSRQASSTFLQILLSFTCFTLPPASSNQGWVCLILTVIIMMMMITVIWTASLTLVPQNCPPGQHFSTTDSAYFVLVDSYLKYFLPCEGNVPPPPAPLYDSRGSVAASSPRSDSINSVDTFKYLCVEHFKWPCYVDRCSHLMPGLIETNLNSFLLTPPGSPLSSFRSSGVSFPGHSIHNSSLLKHHIFHQPSVNVEPSAQEIWRSETLLQVSMSL